MRTRKPEHLNVELSLLGMGAMRLPTKDGQIDYEPAEAIIDYCYEHGVNYYDTAYFYHDGTSEGFLNKALVTRYPRESYYLADKLPMSIVEQTEDKERFFATQLERCGVDYFDFYLLHALNAEQWEKARALGIPDWQQTLKAEGKIRFAGFSFHDSPDVLERILDEGPAWDFVQLQINYFDWYEKDAAELYRLCEARGLPVVVMEPIRGGSLTNLHPDVSAIFTETNPEASLASWALRWVAGLEQVAVILSGMSELAHAQDNCATLTDDQPLSDSEQASIQDVLAALRELPLIPCTDCKYCSDCPQAIDIPGLFNRYNDYITFGDTWGLRQYLKNEPEDQQATACIECGLCESVCPQQIAIMTEIQTSHRKALEVAAK